MLDGEAGLFGRGRPVASLVKRLMCGHVGPSDSLFVARALERREYRGKAGFDRTHGLVRTGAEEPLKPRDRRGCGYVGLVFPGGKELAGAGQRSRPKQLCGQLNADQWPEAVAVGR